MGFNIFLFIKECCVDSGILKNASKFKSDEYLLLVLLLSFSNIIIF